MKFVNLPKVSIIIPVYKAEEYLPKCLDSILLQTFEDWECILIDDGSPDDSARICDEYAARDNRFIVVHKVNGGVSSARNFGLDKAIGEYVMFVDSDDIIANSTLYKCYSQASSNNIDFLQYSLTRNCDDLGIIKGSTMPMSIQKYIEEKFLIVGIGGSFVKRSIIEEYHIRFNESLRLAEDLIFIHNVLAHSNKCQRVYDLLYYYRDNINSSSNNQRTVDMMRSCIAELELRKQYPQFAPTIDYSITHYILSIIINNDYAYDELCKLIRNTQPYNKSHMRGTQLVFTLMSRVSILMAIKLVKWKYRVK